MTNGPYILVHIAPFLRDIYHLRVRQMRLMTNRQSLMSISLLMSQSVDDMSQKGSDVPVASLQNKAKKLFIFSNNLNLRVYMK